MKKHEKSKQFRDAFFGIEIGVWLRNCSQKCRISNKEAVKLKSSTRLTTVSMTVDSKSRKSYQNIRENRHEFDGSNGCSLVLFSLQSKFKLI